MVLPGHTDDGNVDFRKYVDRHAQRGKRANEQNEQGHHDERVWPAQRKTDYAEHVRLRPGVRARGLVKEPYAALCLIDPNLDQACGGDITMFVT